MNRRQRRMAQKSGNAVAARPEDQQKNQIIQRIIDTALELEALSKYQDALNILKQLQDLAPENVVVAYNLGAIFHKTGDVGAALQWLEQARKLQPKSAPIYLALAAAHLDNGSSEKAFSSARKALEFQPDDVLAYAKCANLLCEIGRIDEGITYYRKALELDPQNTAILQDLSRLKKFTVDDEDLKKAENIEKLDLDDEQRLQLNFALGKAYGDIKNYDRSFACYKTANDLKRKSIDYVDGSVAAYIDRISEIYTPDLPEKFASIGNTSQKPIFIVGMPRSGTTLTEQILAAHPDVHGAGELPHFVNAVPFFENPELPDCFSNVSPTMNAKLIENLSPDMLKKIGDNYIQKIDAISPQTQHVTDKLPFNFMWLGLIKLALPQAKIIHVRRDPVDNGFSCYKQYFTHYIPWAYDLDEIGTTYTSYQKLMTYWKSLFGNDIHDVHYEDIISDQEAQTRNLLDYCGLEWNDACLAFHKTKRRVETASVYQVRQPIYKDAVKRRDKYADHLAPLIAALGLENHG